MSLINSHKEELLRTHNVARFGSIELESPIIYSGSIFYKMCTYNLKVPRFCTHQVECIKLTQTKA